MDVPLAVLADAANVSAEGTLNILGIFDTIRAPSFPANHPSAVLVMQFRAKPSEEGQKVPIGIRLLGADSVLVEVAGEIEVPIEGKLRERRVNQLLHLQMLELPAAGAYRFAILVNGEERAEVPFQAIVVEAGALGESG